MKRTYYETPKASRMMRLFWKIAGGDRYLLEKATYSDQLKYTTLGGIVLATGAMAALAGGYAFYTIFAPKSSNVLDKTKTLVENANYTPVDMPTVIMSIFFGIIWGLIIFNIDRFIVTSTGKGDGTEKITWDEFKSAIPRIIMGAIIAITISKPIEIRMFQTEVNLAVQKEQEKEKNSLIEQANRNFESKVNDVKGKLGDNQKIIDERKQQVLDLRNEIKNEIINKNKNGAGEGKRARALEEQAKLIDIQIKDLEDRSDYKNAKNDIRKYELEKQKDIAQAEVKSAALDGLLIRIKKVHELDFGISLFITLLFMAIELTPIFFKLMLIKSTYDFMDDNVKELIKAESGILVEYDYYPNKDGVARDLVIHIEKEKHMIEQKELLELQRRLTKYAIEKYEDSMKIKIHENPSKYITSQDNEA
jgi:hypothetical protein